MSEDALSFSGAVEKAKSWSKIRFDQQSAACLVAHCYVVLRSPAEYPPIIELWNHYVDDLEPAVKTRLENNDWAKTEWRSLLLLSVQSLSMRTGIRRFMPDPFSTLLDDLDKQALWAWHLLNYGMANNPQNPCRILADATMIFMGGPYAAVEIERRAKERPHDFATRFILYNLNSDDGKLPGVEQATVEAIAQLARAAKNHLPSSLRERRPFARRSSDLDTRLDPLELQAVETLYAEFSEGTAEEMFCNEKNLGYVPWTIKNRFLDATRKEMPGRIRNLKREANEIAKAARDQQRKPTEEELDRLKEVDEEIENIRRKLVHANEDDVQVNDTPEDFLVKEETTRLLEQFKAEFPKDWAIIKSVEIDGTPQKAIALDLGITPSAVSQRLAKATRRLHEFIATAD